MDSEEKTVAMESLGRLPLRRIVPQTTDAPTDASTGAYQSNRGHHGRKWGKYQAEIKKRETLPGLHMFWDGPAISLH